MIKEFMGVNIVDLVNKHIHDDIFLKNGCAKELAELTGIDVDDAKDIVEDTYNDLYQSQEDTNTSIKTSFDLNTYKPKEYVSPTPNVTANNVKPKKLSKKKQIKQNKKLGIACCPKCGSTSISTTNKKLSVTRGIVGGALLGPIGAGVGAVTSKKVMNVCMNCGHKWKP